MDHPQAVNTSATERYILGEMTDEEREGFEEHYFSCRECADDVRAAAVMGDGARAGLARGGVTAPERRTVLPLRSVSRGWRPSVALPWAAAAALALAVGYQTIEGPLALRQASGPLQLTSLTPATLRPASRGQEPVVSPGPGGVVTLAVDLGSRQFDHSIHYELRHADGPVIGSGEAPAPDAGGPLLLMVPGSMLKASEHYLLTLESPGVPDLTPEAYRFTVRAP
jgi:hypothetical protein